MGLTRCYKTAVFKQYYTCVARFSGVSVLDPKSFCSCATDPQLPACLLPQQDSVLNQQNWLISKFSKKQERKLRSHSSRINQVQLPAVLESFAKLEVEVKYFTDGSLSFVVD